VGTTLRQRDRLIEIKALTARRKSRSRWGNLRVGEGPRPVRAKPGRKGRNENHGTCSIGIAGDTAPFHCFPGAGQKEVPGACPRPGPYPVRSKWDGKGASSGKKKR